MSNPVYLVVTPFFPTPESWRGAFCYDFARAVARIGAYDVRVPVLGRKGQGDYEYHGLKVARFRNFQPFPGGFCFCGYMANRLQKVVQSEYVAYFYRYLPQSAMHNVRKADDCLRLQRAVLELSQSSACLCEGLDQRVRLAMTRWLRAHAESDIIDWVLMRRGEGERSQEIRRVYRELQVAGVCAGPAVLQHRARFQFWWWSHTGQMWPIVLGNRLIRCLRALFPRG